ncbi:UvrD-helicase domain-containing protein [Blochmannia endosymbiont of Camponotus sp.]|uniref:UvrD-helicase domain-containing protein n=1 Tax=Blochmannia endosymbiont of Camponotus sp. TaxID=700220 RepID=UPI00202522CB|nr:UvrD-helicase domain-containing protein [Blochmannia endosymbiont of Camponotus sp.]URJ23887.1 UvrD-helicase domain-containing protein [Blochmannia endosymbiont of Camponotus sp.]
MNIYNILDQLNDKQREAVTSNDQNILVLSGAGSGKTRVLVNRILWLQLVKKYTPWSIMALTFTNKAASVMRNRIQSLIGVQKKSDLWIGTFHGLANRLLRAHYIDANLSKDFQILDNNDQIQLLKQLIRSLNLNENKYGVYQVMHYINSEKNKIPDIPNISTDNNSRKMTWFRIYQSYQDICNRSGLVDFNELLKRAYTLCLNYPNILHYYQKRFINILVDEFQDTNTVQYAWLRLLSGENNNLMIVGDDDQSIYGWRGAQVKNFQRLLEDFTHVRIIILEQNYRSTNNILRAANTLICKNDTRFKKNLWTCKNKGDAISLYCAFNVIDEAMFVVNNLIDWKKKRHGLLNECAVLYRNNFQSRLLEEILLKKNIPYRIYGGIGFFERKEIRDIIAYLKFIVNHNNDTAYMRIINTPNRGIGQRTLEVINKYANLNHLSLWESSLFISKKKIIKGRPAIALKQFIILIDSLKNQISTTTLPLHEQIFYIIRQIGLWNMYEKNILASTYCERIQNIKEFIAMSNQYSILSESTVNTHPLQQFLSYISLEFEENLSNTHPDAVQLMTLHASKGLEFSQVFIVGLEEGICPNYVSLTNKELLEEERRLIYVGITRAMHKLTISYSETRYIYGKKMVIQSPSRFVNELPIDCLKIC